MRSGEADEAKKTDSPETLAEGVKATAVELYRDGAKGAVQEVGKVVGGLAKLLLTPARLLVEGGNKLVDRLEARLKGIPPERQVPPPATIAGPAVLHYGLLGDGPAEDVLRKMFEDLLVASMDRETASDVHPSLVSIVSQLSSDDAWVLKAMPLDVHAIIEVHLTNNPPYGSFRRLGAICDVAAELELTRNQVFECLSNLDRLGVVTIEWGTNIADESVYLPLIQAMQREFTAEDGHTLVPYKGVIRFTPLGTRLWKTCAIPDARPR